MNASKTGVPETQTGMISPSETELCGESAARYSGKEGAIVDLGCWLGATSVALARGILSDRSKADEKVLGFDQFQWENGIEYLIDCRGRRTVITATHDLHIFEEIAEQCFVLGEGRLVASGTPAEILGDTALLEKIGLVYVHRHRRAGGIVHSHRHEH